MHKADKGSDHTEIGKVGGLNMATFPEPLIQRYDLLKELDIAYDLLDNLRRGGKDAPDEESFLEAKISSIENSLNETLPLIERMIDQVKDDSTAWTAARLHFVHGYEWGHAADRLSLSEDLIKSRVYRRFQAIPEKVWRDLQNA